MKALVLCIFLVGCHGTDLTLGLGRSFNDFSGSGLGDVGGDDHGGDSSSGWAFDQDDSTSAWIELGVQLSPQTVVVESKYPPAPIPVKSYDPGPTAASLVSVEARLTAIEEGMSAIEEETGDHISWKDIGLGGGTAGSGVGLLWLAWLYWKKNKKE